MKTPVTFLSGLVLVTWSLGCASSGSGSKERNIEPDLPPGAVVDEHSSMLTLADFLQRVPGVRITGSGPNTQVEIRGVSSFYLNNEPLFVIDGEVAGTRYAHVVHLVPVKQIAYVRVLKGPDAAIYGVRGGNGVILIVTKK